MSNKSTKTKPVWDIFDIAEIFIICTACIVVIFSLLVRMTVVEGDSMKDTLHDGEYLLVRGAFYTPQRGDIVVVNDVSKKNVGSVYANPLVKRIVAVAGDTVEIKTNVVNKDGAEEMIGVLYVDGKAQDDAYIREYMDPAVMSPTTVGEHEVFVMGDNRNHSGDSRIFGTVDERCIVGKAFMRVFPFNTLTILKNPNN